MSYHLTLTSLVQFVLFQYNTYLTDPTRFFNLFQPQNPVNRGFWVKAVPHRHFIFIIPKILRRYFLYDRKLLSDLSRCGWESLKLFFQETVPEKDAAPGAVIAIQSFGDFLGFNPHLHILCSDGSFYGEGMFRVAPRFETRQLEKIFRYEVFKMLLSKGKITEELIDMLMAWRHSGFNVFCRPRIQPDEQETMENLDRYIIRASFSQERMTYIPENSEVVYHSKDGKEEKIFDALEWIAAMCSDVPNKGEQMVTYYGFYSNVARGKRKKSDQDELIPSIFEPVEDPDFSGDGTSKEYRKNWTRLIQKIYKVDPLTCPKCHGRMRIISFIEDEEVIKKILKHLGLWKIKANPPPNANRPQPNVHIDYSARPGATTSYVRIQSRHSCKTGFRV
ncbi:MAG: transposase [Deltaproteobacteria bacterium]|nr:transposase [Deltaproteobacteria bacterium]